MRAIARHTRETAFATWKRTAQAAGFARSSRRPAKRAATPSSRFYPEIRRYRHYITRVRSEPAAIYVSGASHRLTGQATGRNIAYLARRKSDETSGLHTTRSNTKKRSLFRTFKTANAYFSHVFSVHNGFNMPSGVFGRCTPI